MKQFISELFVDRWLWLGWLLAITLAAGVPVLFGLTWWSIAVVALLLVCPALVAWGIVHVTLD